MDIYVNDPSVEPVHYEKGTASYLRRNTFVKSVSNTSTICQWRLLLKVLFALSLFLVSSLFYKEFFLELQIETLHKYWLGITSISKQFLVFYLLLYRMSSEKKIGIKGKIIHSQAREIIINVMTFLKNEAENGVKIPILNFRERTLAATGISKNTYVSIVKEANNIQSGASTSFSSPRKTRPKSNICRNLVVGEIDTIRDIIHDFYLIEKRRPSLKSILQKIQDSKLSFSGGKTTLSKLLKTMGFRWERTKDNKSALMESYQIRLKRIEYLKKIKQYREQNRPIIYTDETYLHSSHTQLKDWSDGSKDLMKPISKGKRLIIVHAGGENGFIPNGLLIFQSGAKSGDYHDDMNSINFTKWVETQLLPNLPEQAVLVIDNASYHNVQLERCPTSCSRKQEIIEWLNNHQIENDPTETKAQLYKKVLANKHQYYKYKLDSLLEQYGHSVLRLPPYHPELNPIEKIWATMKNWVSNHNVTFKLNDVETLARQKFNEITVEEWRNICIHVKKNEDEYMKKEHLLDDAEDSFRFLINSGESSDDWSEDDFEFLDD